MRQGGTGRDPREEEPAHEPTAKLRELPAIGGRAVVPGLCASGRHAEFQGAGGSPARDCEAHGVQKGRRFGGETLAYSSGCPDGSTPAPVAQGWISGLSRPALTMGSSCVNLAVCSAPTRNMATPRRSPSALRGNGPAIASFP